MLIEPVDDVGAGAAVVRQPAPGRTDVVHLHPALAARYVMLVAAVATEVEAASMPAVCANRVVLASSAPPILRLASWRAERRAFGRRLRRLTAAAGCLVIADAYACYRSIRPAQVERSLADVDVDPVRAGEVRAFLSRLETLGIRGLPVGPPASAVLANAVLIAVDRAIDAAGLHHLRWVDDVVVAARPAEAREVLAVVADAMASVGLRPNPFKTRLVSGRDRAELHLSAAGRPIPVG